MAGGKSQSSTNPDRRAAKGNMRYKATITRLNTYSKGGPIRDKKGKVIGGSLVLSTTAGGKPIVGQARIAPDRRWFGNTRVIAPAELDKFREQMKTKAADPYSVLLRRKKIPMALLHEANQGKEINTAGTEAFEETFGAKSKRKRPKLQDSVVDYSSLMQHVEQLQQSHSHGSNESADKDGDDTIANDGTGSLAKEDLFAKGQSKRIWGELYKVLDCSDVVIEVVDARNVPGTRCYHVEKHIKKNASHKHLIIVINKCDLVPSWVTRKWIKILSKEFPTLAFKANMNKAFGKGALITLLRQFSKLHSNKRQISVGIIGYPNTGKSSVINTLTGNKSCVAAPVPGQTKVWQYVSLTQKIHLIDSPGIVYDGDDHDEVETVLKGVVRAERLKSPSDFVSAILDRVKPEHIRRQYEIGEYSDALDFLSKLAVKQGRLLSAAEPDINSVAKVVINDYQRGKLPHFVAPPRDSNDNDDEEEVEGEEEAGDAAREEGEEVVNVVVDQDGAEDSAKDTVEEDEEDMEEEEGDKIEEEDV